MKCHPVTMGRKNSTGQMASLPKVVARSNAVPIRIPDGFAKIETLIQKFKWNHKGPRIGKAIFKKSNVGRITLPNFKTPVQNSTQRQQTEAGTRNSLLKWLTFDKDTKDIPWGKYSLLNKDVKEWQPHPTHEVSKNLSVRAKNKTNESDFTKFAFVY